MRVGRHKFPYTRKGMKAGMEHAEETGQKPRVKKPKKKTRRMK